MTVLTHNCYFYIVHEVWYLFEIPMISLNEVHLLVSKSLPPTIPSHLSVFRPPFLSLLFLEDPSLRISTHLGVTTVTWSLRTVLFFCYARAAASSQSLRTVL